MLMTSHYIALIIVTRAIAAVVAGTVTIVIASIIAVTACITVTACVVIAKIAKTKTKIPKRPVGIITEENPVERHTRYTERWHAPRAAESSALARL
jgi:hypothetical protein